MNKANGKNNKLLIFFTIVIIILLIITFGLAYAKYVSTANGTVTAQIANMICEMKVQSSSEDENGNPIQQDPSIVNPYCTITIKNYEGQTPATATKVTQANLNYTIKVTPKEQDFILPDYYWQNVQTGEIIHTEDLQGTCTKGQAQNQQYRIVFINTNTEIENLQKHVDFNLTAVQAKSE